MHPPAQRDVPGPSGPSPSASSLSRQASEKQPRGAIRAALLAPSFHLVITKLEPEKPDTKRRARHFPLQIRTGPLCVVSRGNARLGGQRRFHGLPRGNHRLPATLRPISPSSPPRVTCACFCPQPSHKQTVSEMGGVDTPFLNALRYPETTIGETGTLAYEKGRTPDTRSHNSRSRGGPRLSPSNPACRAPKRRAAVGEGDRAVQRAPRSRVTRRRPSNGGTCSSGRERRGPGSRSSPASQRAGSPPPSRTWPARGGRPREDTDAGFRGQGPSGLGQGA